MQVYCAPICGLLETKILARKKKTGCIDNDQKISCMFSNPAHRIKPLMRVEVTRCGSCGMTEDVFGDRRVSTHVSHNETKSARGSGPFFFFFYLINVHKRPSSLSEEGDT